MDTNDFEIDDTVTEFTRPPQVMIRLVKLVMRAFYEQEHIIIMDSLLKWGPMTDAELSKRLNLLPKFVKSKLTELKSEYMLQNKIEVKKKSSKQTIETVTWSLDLKLFVDTVKYRLYKLKQEVVIQQQTHEEYQCKNEACGMQYNAYDIVKISDFYTGTATCEHCGGEVEETQQIGSTGSGGDTLEGRVDKDLRKIFELLTLTENYAIPLSTKDDPFSVRTKEEAIEENARLTKQIHLMNSMGAHARSSSSSSAGSLGGSGTGSNAMGARSINNDLSLNVVIEDEDAKNKTISAEEHAAKNKKRKQDKMKQQLPHFLQKKNDENDYLQAVGVHTNNASEENQDQDEDDTLTTKKDIKFDEQAYAELQDYVGRTKENVIEDTVVDNVQEERTFETSADSDIVVSVSGVMKNINEITQEDKDRMTKEEYDTYMSYIYNEDDY
ncbi:transcription initiation factor TFIIE subunit alpha [Acrasis kona]|uniref:Transcription initiation factor TFIIE subunit alpha n=1 Tax=Acrasis kona TaxID=1008807 RepID=A0AAW2YVP9_9EUKA